MSGKLNRYANIDIIRGIAALLVVWLHVSEVFRSFLPAENADVWIYRVAERVDFGRIGVVAFFAVSGFVIPASFHYQGLFGLKVFMIRRFFRLFPAFWLSIPFALWSAWYLWGKPITVELVWANLTMLPSLFGQLPIEGLYWTLEIELLFYLLCVILFLWGKVHDTNVLVSASTLCLLVFVVSKLRAIMAVPAFIWIDEGLGVKSLFLAIMFWGAVYRKWYDDRSQWRRYWNIVLYGVPVMIVVLIPAVFLYKMFLIGNMQPEWVKFFAAHALGLTLFIALASWRTLSFTPLNKLGEISYSVYLFHPVVFYPFYWWVGRTSFAWVRSLPLEVWVVGMMGASAVVAYGIFRWVEKPAIEYSRNLSRSMVSVAT